MISSRMRTLCAFFIIAGLTTPAFSHETREGSRQEEVDTFSLGDEEHAEEHGSHHPRERRRRKNRALAQVRKINAERKKEKDWKTPSPAWYHHRYSLPLEGEFSHDIDTISIDAGARGKVECTVAFSGHGRTEDAHDAGSKAHLVVDLMYKGKSRDILQKRPKFLRKLFGRRHDEKPTRLSAPQVGEIFYVMDEGKHVVLHNIEALGDGDFPVRVRITGPKTLSLGNVFGKEVTVKDNQPAQRPIAPGEEPQGSVKTLQEPAQQRKRGGFLGLF